MTRDRVALLVAGAVVFVAAVVLLRGSPDVSAVVRAGLAIAAVVLPVAYAAVWLRGAVSGRGRIAAAVVGLCVLLVVVVGALRMLPRYELRTIDRRVYRLDRWTGAIDVVRFQAGRAVLETAQPAAANDTSASVIPAVAP